MNRKLVSELDKALKEAAERFYREHGFDLTNREVKTFEGARTVYICVDDEMHPLLVMTPEQQGALPVWERRQDAAKAALEHTASVVALKWTTALEVASGAGIDMAVYFEDGRMGIIEQNSIVAVPTNGHISPEDLPF